MKPLIMIWGRMNPIHRGHFEMISDSLNRAISEGADFKVFLTKTQDSKINPLSYEDKMLYLSLLISDKYIGRADTANVFKLVEDLSKKHSSVELVVGGDRVKNFSEQFDKYKDLFSCPIKISKFADRDKYPISSSEMRRFATEGDWKKFIDNCPPLTPYRKLELYRLTSIGLNRTVRTKNESKRGFRSDSES